MKTISFNFYAGGNSLDRFRDTNSKTKYLILFINDIGVRSRTESIFYYFEKNKT